MRSDAAGEPEIFYQGGDNEEETASSSSPFPNAGGFPGLKPRQSSAFADLGGPKSDTEEAMEMEALEEASEAEEIEEAPAAVVAPAVAAAPAPPPKKVAPAFEPAPEPEPEAAEEPAPLIGRGSVFGDASDHVDPSFGKDGPVFDPEKGKVEGPPAEAGPGPGPGRRGGKKRPVGARGVPPTQQKAMADGEPREAEAAPRPAGPTRNWDDDDLAPHRIGGGPGTKLAVFLLILSLVAMGFVGVVAARNDGMVDFKNFSHMLEVAFTDASYQPRAEWVPQRAATVVMTPEDPVQVESVYAQLVPIGRDAQVFVVKGMVRNTENRLFDGVELRAMITTPEGRVLQNIVGTVGQNVQIHEIAEERAVADAMALVQTRGGQLQARDIAPFTMLFEEVPHTVRQGENFLLKVEIANQPRREVAASQE